MKEKSAGANRLGAIFIAVAAVLGLGTLLVWGFLESRSEAAVEAQREQAITPDIEVSRAGGESPAIAVSPALQKEAGIQLMQPKPAPHQLQIEAYGTVTDLQLFTELSNTIANAKAQLASANAKLAASQAAFERAQALHNNGQIVSTAQMQSAEASYGTDQANFKGAQVQTHNAASTASQTWGPVLGKSLVDGTGLAKELLEHQKVLVQVTLPLGVSLSQPPQSASIETTTRQRVRIDFVSAAPRTDPKIQGLSFFYTADIATGALPGMNVIAFLPTGPTVLGITIPPSAIVWLQGLPWVYLETRANTFTRREIPTAMPFASGGYIVPIATAKRQLEHDQSLPSTDTTAQEFPKDVPIVISGAQALLSQEFSAQIQVGGD